ncbi:MAG: sugar-binding protein [Flavobacteriales bacterium]
MKTVFVLSGCCPIFSVGAQESVDFKTIPRLSQEVIIDGNLDDWKTAAFNDGEWNLERVQSSPWYESARNKLTIHDGETGLDLASTYYLAWDENYLYLGAEVKDNVNDVTESKHQPKRWYYKDAIAWFFEYPMDTIAEEFGSGDHGFAFVIDSLYPSYGAWWRHGDARQTYVETPLPQGAFEYVIKFNPWNRSEADYVLEAKISAKQTMGNGDEHWTPIQPGNKFRMMIVHCDPDGGEYGGHLLIYGKGDDDGTWTEFEFE